MRLPYFLLCLLVLGVSLSQAWPQEDEEEGEAPVEAAGDQEEGEEVESEDLVGGGKDDLTSLLFINPILQGVGTKSTGFYFKCV